jgi:hypothetical protein
MARDLSIELVAEHDRVAAVSGQSLLSEVLRVPDLSFRHEIEAGPMDNLRLLLLHVRAEEDLRIISNFRHLEAKTTVKRQGCRVLAVSQSPNSSQAFIARPRWNRATAGRELPQVNNKRIFLGLLATPIYWLARELGQQRLIEPAA